jgi:hypothetical protein
MATISLVNKALPLNEIANRLDRDGSLGELAFTMMEKNQLLEVLPFKTASAETHHDFSKVVSVPTGTWTKRDKGVNLEHGGTRPAKEYMGTIESYSQVDVRNFRGVERSAAAGLRLQEDKLFMTGLTQSVSHEIIYGNLGEDPNSLDGIFARGAYNITGGPQVIDAGGTGSDLMSILIMELGDDTMYGIYPNGTKAGIETEDKGEEPKYDSDGKRYDVLTTHFIWDLGFVVKDDRAIVRIANLEDAVINDSGDNGGLSDDLILDALAQLPNMGEKSSYIFLNRRSLRNLQKVAKDRVNVTYDPTNPFGRKWIRDYMGTPIKMEEQLVLTESVIS